MIIEFKNTDTEKYISMVREYLGECDRYACVLTFGCQQNEADSEKLRSMALMMGYKLTESPEMADLIVVNTCAIRAHAEMKVLSLLGRLKELKAKKPSLVLALVGCMAAEEHMAKRIKGNFKYVSFTLEPSMIYEFPRLVYRYILSEERSFVFNSDEGNLMEGIPPVRMSKYKAWVSVMYGCNNFCSYCIVPYVRGRERSRDSRDIIRECRELVASGYKEITLLGQNVNSYKSDIDFADLLEEVANIDGDFTVRFMTSHPKDASDKLISVVGRYCGKIAPSFHLPLQSGSNAILKAMNRTYDRERFLSIVEKLRLAVPNIALTSDIIVGFPGESEEDFEDTLDVLKSVKFDMVYAFIYSPREGTRAAKMDNQIPKEIKSARMNRLLDLQNEISLEKNLEYVGTVQRALVDGISERDGQRLYVARTMTNKLVKFASEEAVLGQFVELKINRAGPFELFGEEKEL